jgi:hypothetical protein
MFVKHISDTISWRLQNVNRIRGTEMESAYKTIRMPTHCKYNVKKHKD